MGSVSIVHWLILLGPLVALGLIIWILKTRGH